VAWISQVSLSEAEGSLGKAESQQRTADRALESWLSSVPVENGQMWQKDGGKPGENHMKPSQVLGKTVHFVIK